MHLKTVAASCDINFNFRSIGSVLLTVLLEVIHAGFFSSCLCWVFFSILTTVIDRLKGVVANVNLKSC